MADYRYAGDTLEEGVIRLQDDACIPNDDRNRDWIEYMVYRNAGGLTDPWMTTEEEEYWQAIEDRFALIEAELEIDKIYDKTPDEVHQWLDDKRATATTNEEHLDVIYLVMKKIATHLLR